MSIDLAQLEDRLRDERHTDRFIFREPVSEANLSDTEARLGFRFPDSFRWFLKTFGAALVGEQVAGIRDPEAPDFVEMAQKLRHATPPLPEHLVAFAKGTGPWDDSYLCFDTQRKQDNEYLLTNWTPQAKPEQQIEWSEDTFLSWLIDEVGFAEENAMPPRDWSKPGAWDRYWHQVLADEEEHNWNIHSEINSKDFLEILKTRNPVRLLCAGNGISLEPYSFVHCGFDVTALDISSVASEFVHNTRPTPEELSRFFTEHIYEYDPKWKVQIGRPDAELTRARMQREYRPGGKLTVVTADMFRYEPEERFDAIISNRSFQGFAESEWYELTRRFHTWLNPGGICYLELHNILDSSWRARMEQAFTDLGFFVYQKRTREWYLQCMQQKWPWSRIQEEYEQRSEAEGCEERQRLDAGEKMVIFYYGSG